MDNNNTAAYEPKELRKLVSLGLSQDELSKYDVLVLPENFDSDNKEEIVDAQDAIQVSKLLKGEGVNCANSYDLGLHETPTLERRSNDVWLGHIYILNDIVIPTVVSVIANVITPLITHKKNKADKRTPTGEIHVEITIARGSDISHLKYTGDAETFDKMMQSLTKND